MTIKDRLVSEQVGNNRGGGACCEMSLCSACSENKSFILFTPPPSQFNFSVFPFVTSIKPHVVNSRRIAFDNEVIKIHPNLIVYSLEFSEIKCFVHTSPTLKERYREGLACVCICHHPPLSCISTAHTR